MQIKNSAETDFSHYRARYYDTSTGRFLNEDPFDQGSSYPSNLYAYVENNPAAFVDPFGLYKLKPQKNPIPAPSAALDSLLNRMERILNTQLTVTATTPLPGEPHEDPGHAGGTSVDIRPPAGIPADKVFCAAGQCGAARGLNEGPGGVTTTFRTADNYHLQLNPTHNPKKRNDIPPGCAPGPGPGGKSCPKAGQPAPCPDGFRCT